MEDSNKLAIQVAKLEQSVVDLSARVERGFSEIKDSLVGRIKNLECDKADKDQVEKLQVKVNNDIEKRVVDLETMKEQCKQDIEYLKEKVDTKADKTILNVVIAVLGIVICAVIYILTGYKI